MTTLEDLVKLVEDDPINPICSAMLIDELMDERDMNRSEAEAHVKRVAEVAIDAAFLRRAADLVSGCSWQRGWVRSTLADALPGYIASLCTIVLVPGLTPPVIASNPSREVDEYWRSYLVTVGAQWLYRQYRELLASRTARRRELKEAKRK